MKVLVGQCTGDQHYNKGDRVDQSQDEPETKHPHAMGDGAKFVRCKSLAMKKNQEVFDSLWYRSYLSPHVKCSDTKSQKSTNKVNFEDSSFLKVGHQAQSESSKPSQPKSSLIQLQGLAIYGMAKVELMDLLVSDVDHDSHKQSPKIDQLAARNNVSQRKDCASWNGT